MLYDFYYQDGSDYHYHYYHNSCNHQWGKSPAGAPAIAVHVLSLVTVLSVCEVAVTVIFEESPSVAVLGILTVSTIVLEEPAVNVILGGVTESVGPQLCVSLASRLNVSVAVPLFLMVTENRS